MKPGNLGSEPKSTSDRASTPSFNLGALASYLRKEAMCQSLLWPAIHFIHS